MNYIWFLNSHIVAPIFFIAAQLRDVVYSTKRYKPRPEILPVNPVNKSDATLHLERGQGFFEFHINKITLSSAAVHAFGDREPATFCCFTFYDFQLETTPVLYGNTQLYHFTSQHRVKIDDCFLNYLRSNSITLEFHHAYGRDHETVAICQVALHETLEQNGRIYGSGDLVGN